MSYKQGWNPKKAAIIILLLALSPVIAVVLKKTQLKASTASQPVCYQQLLETDTIVSQLPFSVRQSFTNFPSTDVLIPYLTNAIVPTCPYGGTIRIGIGHLATHCLKHGAVMLPAPPPPKRSLSDFIPFLRSCSMSSKNACIANLKQMDGAAQQWALENKKTDADLIVPLEAAQYLKGGVLPTCPHGGKYWFNVVSNPPYRTVTGHSLP